jgi:hypothetical protein
MRSFKPVLVKVALGRINFIAHRYGMALHTRAATVSESGWCGHLVVVGENWEQSLPGGVARHTERVQQHQGRLIGEDVAYLALFLASDDSRTITGQSIPVDAGGYMQG